MQTAPVIEAEATQIETLASAKPVEQEYLALTGELERLKATALTLEVKDITDVAGMKLARLTRLTLRDIRLAVDKRRAELKADVLEKGRRIDGAAKEIITNIEALEKRLLEQEKFIERLQEAERARLQAEREGILRGMGVESMINSGLGDINDPEWGIVLRDAKAVQAAREAEAKRLEEERVAAEKAAAEERERQARELAEARAKAEEERKAREAAEAAAKAEREAAEAALRAEREAAAEEARKQAEVARRVREQLEAAAMAEREAAQAAAKAAAEAARVAREEAERQRKEEAAKLEARLKAEFQAKAEAERKEREAAEAELRASQEAAKRELAAAMASRAAAEPTKAAPAPIGADLTDKEKLREFIELVKRSVPAFSADASLAATVQKAVRQFASYLEAFIR